MNLVTKSIVATLSALAAAATAAGCSCGGDDYFCDDTGCYYCDGLGCREADAPPRTECTGDWQCAADERCTEDGCTLVCGLDEDCPDGTICAESGFCLAPGSEDPVLEPGDCTATEECGAGGLCLDGLCVADPGTDPVDDPSDDPGNDPGDDPGADPGTDPGDDPGSDPGDVPGDDPGDNPSDPGNPPGGGDEIPVGPAPQCTVQSDCAAGWDCINAVCKLGCSTDSQCGEGCECNDEGWCSGPGFDE